MTRVLYALLAAVAAAAAVLSFSALRDLAAACGFSPALAWLLPVVVDAGAAAGTLVWLGGRAPDRARRFARVLALVLLASSVAANALGHGLAAYAVAPHWTVVVLVSAVAPAVLGATVHLAVLTGRPAEPGTRQVQLPADDEDPPDWWADAPLADLDDAEPGSGSDRAAELLAEGAGRRRIARELGISEHEARQLLTERRNGHQAVSR